LLYKDKNILNLKAFTVLTLLNFYQICQFTIN